MAAIFCLVSLAAAVGRAAEPTAEQAEFFELSIRPVLASVCFECHGGESTSGGLRVDSREALLIGGERGPAILPGKPQDSLLVKALRHADAEVQMPPDEPLATATIDAFSHWIETGAEWPAKAGSEAFRSERHWAFQPIADPQPPAAAPGESAHPIDRFIAARLRPRV